MFDNFIYWFDKNRKTIGYTLGALNVLGGLQLIGVGVSINGLIQVFAGSVLIYDAYTMKSVD